jgi:hypothetical protein
MAGMLVDKLPWWLVRCVAFLFRLYPRNIRQELEQEMLSVYYLAAQEALRSGVSALLHFIIRELFGVLAEVIREYWLLVIHKGGGQMVAMQKGKGIAPNDPSSLLGDSHSLGTLLAGSAIFLTWGLEAIFNEIAYSSKEPRFTAFITTSFLLSWLIYLLPPVVLGYAYIHNFPRWTYPYVGSALLYTYFVAANLIVTPHITLFRINLGGEAPWGWRAWLPLILAIGIAVIITRSLRPLKRFLTNIWTDWTLLSYAMFGWAPLLFMASFDEVASGYALTFMPLVVAIIIVTALLYLASRCLSQRAWFLFAGAFFSLAITLAVNEVYWSGVAAFSLPRIGLILAVFLTVLFSPALIGVFRQFQRHGALHQA